ncbi:MAG: mechanosensitive ion channel family protein [Candidatus Krumholzibacteriota bacterium]|nr:mechanosensitive ion channel family protein [Candidatus Krumholzibacteriota bacterium]
MNEFVEALSQFALTSGIRIAAIVAGAFITVRIFKIIIRRFLSKYSSSAKVGIERAKRAETLSGLIETTLKVVILITVLLMVLKEVGIDITPLLAGAGIVGLAVGFGAQSLVKDIISGFFMLLENHLNVGDVVEIAGKAGLVESMNLRITVMRDFEGKVHIVPNGEISVVTNFTKEYSRALIEIGVAYKEDVDRVIGILKEVGEEIRKDETYGPKILEPMEVIGLDSFGSSSINIKVRFKTKPIEQWSTSREYRRLVKKRFDKENIEIPFPHVTLYMGEGENDGVLKVDAESKEIKQ